MTRSLPEGTIGYVAGSGTDSVGAAFKKTALGKVLGNDQIKTIFDTFWAQVMITVEKRSGPDETKAANLVVDFVKLVCRRPFIAGISENTAGGKVPISGFLIIDAGPVRKEINRLFREYEKFDTDGKIIRKLVGPCRMKVVKIFNDQYVYWGFAGRKFVIAVCDKDGLVLKNIFWPSKDTQKNLSKIPQAGDALIINYDYQAILSMMEKFLKKAAPNDYKKVMTLLDDLGVADMGNVTARLGFSGSDIVVGEAVEIPSPRKGLFSCYGNIDMAIFDLVEPQAVEAGAMNVDIARFCDVICNSFKKVVPENILNKIAHHISAFEKMTNVNIREGILGSIAGEGVYYAIPAGVMMESPTGGFVAIARLKDDGAKFEQSMNALGKFAAGKSGGMLQISSLPKGDVTIHAWTVMPLAMMQIMPCWAIVDGNVVLASNAVLCGKAIDRIKSDDASKDSLRSTVAFKTAVKGLPDELTSLIYTDSKVQFKQMTIQLQQVWPMVTMMAMRYGTKLPAMLPNFDDAMKDLTPSASYSWFDKDGAYSRYKGSGVEVGAAAIVGGAMGVAIVMPALGKVKKLSTSLVSATNLKVIGRACMVYAFDNTDTYPPNLEILIKEADLSPKTLVSPQKPKNFKGPSYIYIAGQDGPSNPGNILVYENPAYLLDKTNVLYVDGHVERVKCDKFIKDLKATYKRLGKEAPEIKFLKDIQAGKKNKQDQEFQEQMKKSQEKIKKQLEEQEKTKDLQKKDVKPKKVRPKKGGHKAVAAAIAS